MSDWNRLDALELVATIAGAVVLETKPRAKRNKYSVAATVPYALIDKLDDALRAAGYDLDAARRSYEAIKEKLP